MKRLLSFFMVLAILFTTLLTAGCAGRFENYCDSNLAKYVKFSASDMKGKTLLLSGIYPEVTREDALHELDFYRLVHADAEKGEVYDVYSKAPGLWDQAYIYYDLTLTENGESIASNLYSEEGTQLASTGYWMFEDKLSSYIEKDGLYHPIFTSKTLSDAMMETLPAGRTYFADGEAFSHTEGAILYIDYQLSYDKSNMAPKSASDLRIDTSMRDFYVAKYGEAFFNALLDPENKYGKNFEVKTTVKDSLGNDVSATYTVKVKYVSEESFKTVSVALPENAFDETYSDTLQALNGKTVYLHFVIHHFTDFVVSDLNGDFVINQLGYVPTKEEDNEEKVIEGAVSFMLKKLEDERTQLIKDEAIMVFLETYYKPELVKRLPKKLYNEQYDFIVSTIESAYIKALNEAAAKGEEFPYKSVHEFAADYTTPKYSLEEFPTLQSYADTVATETASYRLFVMAMAQLADVRMSYVELRQEYDYVYSVEADRFKSQYGREGAPEEVIALVTNGQCATEEEFEWYILWTITYGALTDYIYENNTCEFKNR